jgi:hypothetical protein
MILIGSSFGNLDWFNDGTWANLMGMGVWLAENEIYWDIKN